MKFLIFEIPDLFSLIFFKLFFQLHLFFFIFEVGNFSEYVFRFRILWSFQWCYFQSDSGTSSEHTDRFSNKMCFKTQTFWWNSIGWYVRSDSREAHKIDPHMRYGASKNLIKEYSLFINSMRLLKTKK